MEPRLKVAEVAQLCDVVSREILQLKAKGDRLIFVGGDMNRKNLDDAFQDFPDINQCNFDPTRGDACLDIMFSNCTQLIPENWPPLETNTGVRSDHLCVVFSGKQQRIRDFTWIKKMARKHSDAAVAEYGRRLAEADWKMIMPGHLPPDEMIERFQAWTTALTDELFPMKTVRCRNNEPPWMTDGIRRIAKHKIRVFKREKKSPLWWQLQRQQDVPLKQSQEAYVDRITKAGTNTRKYFEAVKQLGGRAANTGWDLTDLYPGKPPEEAGREAADYFTRITDLFDPLEEGEVVGAGMALREPVTREEVAKRLREAKKPSSSVEGDLLPRVVKAHHQQLVEPVTEIFNAVFRTGKWPTAWKDETTVVIPKVPNPEGLGDCRNISCTPFLSKVLEGILLDDLRASIPVDPIQYGGIKGCSVDHLLVD